MLQMPEDLDGLPVQKVIPKLPLDRSFICIAHTGSGKTMIIPPAIHLISGRKVVLRQPTRASALEVYNGLKQFWGDQLSVGIHTSEIDIGSLDECDIMVCTDGVMKSWLREPKHDLTVVFDEFHQQMAITEVELGIVKTYLNEGINFEIVMLSATIRPSNIIEYFESLNPNEVNRNEIQRVCDLLEKDGEKVNTTHQPQWLKVFYSEGQPHHITDKLVTWGGMEESKTKPGPLLNWCKDMFRRNERGIAFMTTRKEITRMANVAKSYVPGLMTNFVHADCDIQKIVREVWSAEENDIPYILFSTPVFATSVTLPFDEVFVVDRGLDTVYEYGFEKTLTDVPRSNNDILQMRGRCGRIKKGVFTLASYHRGTLNGLRPSAIEPPLEKCSPDQFVMTCGMYSLDPLRLDVMSSIPNRDIRRSVGKLKWWGVIEEDEDDKNFLSLVAPIDQQTGKADLIPGQLRLTGFGRGVSALPLPIDMAVMVRRAPKDILPILVAIASTNSLYSMFKSEIDAGNGQKLKGYEMLDPNLKQDQCTMLTKAKIIQGAIMARDNPGDSLPNFAAVNGIWKNALEKALYQFYQVCKALNKSERKMRNDLMMTDIDTLAWPTLEFLTSLKIFEKVDMWYSPRRGEDGYKGQYEIWDAFLSGVELSCLQTWGSREIQVMGTPRQLSANGYDFVVMENCTILDGD